MHRPAKPAARHLSKASGYDRIMRTLVPATGAAIVIAIILAAAALVAK